MSEVPLYCTFQVNGVLSYNPGVPRKLEIRNVHIQVAHLHSVRNLNLSHNRIGVLPAEIGKHQNIC